MNFDSILATSGGSIYTLVAFVIAISVIVAIHEYGHYIVGRWCGIHAEVFSLGFGKVLFSKTDRHGTKWQVAALPFGGYVKFLGDANAASVGGTANVDGFSERNTMLGAPLWGKGSTGTPLSHTLKWMCGVPHGKVISASSPLYPLIAMVWPRFTVSPTATSSRGR